MISTASNILHYISDHGNAIASKFIVWFGIGGMGYSGEVAVSESATKAKQVIEPVQHYQHFDLSTIGLYISMVSGVCLIIKTISDIYFSHKESRYIDKQRQKEEQEKLRREG